jgi:carboxymethylenebutenolidase
MCDLDTPEEWNDHVNSSPLSRRHFMAISAGLSMSSLLAMFPSVANAADVSESDVTIKTADGTCDAYFVHPAQGASAAVIVWPDILGLRPAFRAMGKRLAENGYAVLVVNPFYRKLKAPVVADGASFQDQKVRDVVFPLMQSLTADGTFTDAKAFVAWLDQQAAVDKSKKIGTTGYCMGGPLVVRTSSVSDRIGAGATFHGGGLTTADANSPHLLLAKTKASFLIAIAEGDDKQDPKSKDILKETFAKNGQKATVEVYTGCAHGWTVPDFPVYDKAGAEKAWAAMLDLFKTALA